MRQKIDKVAVIGAGTMGAAIAAHFANAGVPVYLLDIVPNTLDPAEQAKGLTLNDPSVRNRIVSAGLERVKRLKPPAFFTKSVVDLIAIGNLEDDFARLAEADWIVEAVVENLDLKRELMARIDQVRKPAAIVSSNTSGIPIASIAAGRSAGFRAHFLGTHFFNPPRYLKLLEVIPTPDTQLEVIATLTSVATRTLGKRVVVCNDSPNFVANRLASMTGAFALSYAIEHGYTVGEVDTLTGNLIGRPKTATFRLSDLVGLDVVADVRGNLYPAIAADEDRAVLVEPAMLRLLDGMLERGWLGNKSAQGFYKTIRAADGSREFWELNLRTLEYERPQEKRFESVRKARKIESLPERLRMLLSADDRAAGYLWATTAWTLAYASKRVPEITPSLAAIDEVVKSGFAHELGPFEIWDELDVQSTVARMIASGYAPAHWVQEMLAAGCTTFYQYQNGLRVGYFDPVIAAYQPLVERPGIIFLKDLKSQGKVIKQNLSASLIDLGDDVACLEFHSKMNALDPDIVALAQWALDEVDRNFAGLVIGNDGEQFCVGANLFNVAFAAQQGAWDLLEQGVKGMQDTMMALRFSRRPVVSAPFGMALGGGAEISMAAGHTCASAELYMGQVESAVGLIPAAGGCKELLRRVVSPPMRTPGASVLPFLQKAFETIALAKVSGSAAEARELGFLSEADRIVMNRDRLIDTAKKIVLSLVEADYRPPSHTACLFAAGRDSLAALLVAIRQMEVGGFASSHDALIARKLAYVLCGGDISAAQWVEEQYILDLEREAFLSLLGEPKTIERIWHMLQTGKPLRN